MGRCLVCNEVLHLMDLVGSIGGCDHSDRIFATACDLFCMLLCIGHDRSGPAMVRIRNQDGDLHRITG